MLRDITIGQYYSVDSRIHRLDPRVKIRFTIIYIILSFIDRNILLFGMLTFFLIIAALLSEIPLSHIIKGTRTMVVFIFVCSALNIFTTYGKVVISLGFLHITDAGIVKAGFVFWRMLLIIFMSSILMYTTTPTELTDGLEKCFHISGSVAMSITIALRFVSVLSEEMSRIMKAQEARGADFHSGGIIKRIKGLRIVIIPLFQNAIYRACNLGDAMDARCYTGGKGRTKLIVLRYKMADLIAYIVLTFLIAGCVYATIRF